MSIFFEPLRARSSLRFPLLLSLMGLAALAGCGGSSAHQMTNDMGTVSPPPEAQPGCNPIVGDDCLTPYPAFFHEQADTTSATGVRVALSATALPVQGNGIQISPDRLNQKDGFSPATPFIVYFANGADAAQLPTLDDIGNTLTATSTVQVIDYATGDHVPVMAELDTFSKNGRQGLIIRPQTRLQPATRYIIVLLKLNDSTGAPLVPLPFKALRDGTPLSQSLLPWKAHYDEIFAALTKYGVSRGDLSLAWDVVTASDDTATSHVLKMRDEALAAIPPAASPGPTAAYNIVDVEDYPSPSPLARAIHATVKVPNYLKDDTGTSQLNFGSDGLPASTGMIDVPILIHIPQCALTATQPVRTVIFGHGLFASAELEMDTPTLESVGQSFCLVFVGTDWWGLSHSDIPNIENLLAEDLNQVYFITDRLQQAHTNAAVMTRTFLTQIKNDPRLDFGHGSIIDPAQTYYFGISLGGIEGTTFMGLNEDITKGVLNVPGCEWSLLIFRSTDFNPLSPLLALALSDPLDQQVAIMSTQSEWDYTDAATFAPHLLASPLPHVVPKHILVQESEGDAQVTNVATRVLARTMGLPGLDLEHPIYGIPTMTPTVPLDSAYTQWDSMPAELPPVGDQPLSMDNGAHDAVYPNPLAQSQIDTFLTPNGQVTSVCGGPCIFSQQ